MNRTTHFALAAAGIAALCGSTFGQARGGGGNAEEFNQPLNRPSARAAQAQPSSRIIMLNSDGQARYELRVEDGQTTAKVDGREVPAERIRRSGEKVEILGRRGEVLTTFDLSGIETGRGMGGGRALRLPQGGSAWVAPSPMAPEAPVAPPKVMLGINMAEPSESLLEQMDLEPGTAVLVTGVVEGLPADQAGLKVNDIIVKIDGKEPVSGEKIKETLRGKEVGDTLELTVLRKGESKKIKVKLAKYEGDKLIVGMGGAAGGGPATVYRFAPGQDMPDAERMLKEHLERFRVEGGEMPPMVWGPRGEGGEHRFFIPGGRDSAEVERLEKRLKTIEEQLARVNEQLARLERQLQRRE
jgi:hypothetical protein